MGVCGELVLAHCLQFAAENGLVKRECFCSVAGERNVGVKFGHENTVPEPPAIETYLPSVLGLIRWWRRIFVYCISLFYLVLCIARY